MKIFLIIIILSSLSLIAAEVPVPMPKISYSKMKLNSDEVKSIEDSLVKLMKKYINSFSLKDYESFKECVFPSFLSF